MSLVAFSICLGPQAGARQPFEHVYLVEEVPYLFLGGPNTPPAGQWEHLPQGPASEGHAGSLSRSTFLPPFVPTQQHVQTSLEG